MAFRATLDADRRHEQRVIAKRCSRTTALSSALRKFERSRGPKALGPDVAWPVERRWSIRLRVARAMPIELSLKRFPFGAMTSAPDSTHRLASGMCDVTTIAPGPGPLGDPLVRGVRARPDDDPLNLLRPRDHNRAVRDNENCQPVASRDAIDLILHRTGVGVDKDTQRWSGRFHVGAVCDQPDQIKSARSTERMAGRLTSRSPPARAALRERDALQRCHFGQRATSMPAPIRQPKLSKHSGRTQSQSIHEPTISGGRRSRNCSSSPAPDQWW